MSAQDSGESNTETLLCSLASEHTSDPQQLGEAQQRGGLLVARGGLAKALLDEAEPVRVQSHCRERETKWQASDAGTWPP